MGIYKAGKVQSDFVHTFVTAADRGDVFTIEDVLAFANTDVLAGQEGAVLYKCDTCRADKKIGTGYDIIKGQRLYIDMNDFKVSPTKSAGFLFVGWAQEDADGADTDVKMEYDGTLSTIF